MMVYHGSNMIVEKPELRVPNRSLDYGDGFYTTLNLMHAERFASNVVSRNDGRGVPIVSYYEVDYDKILQEFDVLVFDRPDDKWGSFQS